MRYYVLLFLIISIGSFAKETVTHTVLKNETLFSISKLYNVSVADIKKHNNLESNTIKIGQELQIEKIYFHTVKEGDSLWSIAQEYDIEILDLKEMNDLSDNSVFIGQHIKLEHTENNERKENFGIPAKEMERILTNEKDSKTPETNPIEVNILKNDNLDFDLKSKNFLLLNSDKYYNYKPKAKVQNSEKYIEFSEVSIKTNISYSQELISLFDDMLSKKTKLSDKLKDWKIVIDPGHGGIDPGAIVKSSSGLNNPVYVTEDEYVYDISLRLYSLIKLHGGETTLTILSPNHLIRESNPARMTFVNEKNEVFNYKYLDDKKKKYPLANNYSLNARTRIANNFIGDNTEKTIFISIHADNSKYLPKASSVWYYKNSKYTDDISKKFAQSFTPYLGEGAFTKGSGLYVLNKIHNNCKYKILIEAKNIFFKNHSWVLRYEKTRQDIAENIVNALIDSVN